ncbi:MAG: cytochrome c-type biogenesis protein CcmH [Gammaproteobacteria bacterium]|nr:cytochrome c-type biogenesis protein CcmH [Gammaproteobacteria bacterium]
MIRLLALLLVLSAAAPAAAIDSEPAFDDPVLQQRYERLTQELRCLVCQNQSIADSNATLAADLRREVRRLLAEGRTDDEVRAFVTGRYGDFVLYRPPVTQRTWLLWAAPALLLLVGLGIAAAIVSRRARTATANGIAGGDEDEA